MLTFFRNYFTITGVKEGIGNMETEYSSKPRIGTLHPLKTFFQKNLTKNTAYGIINLWRRLGRASAKPNKNSLHVFLKKNLTPHDKCGIIIT